MYTNLKSFSKIEESLAGALNENNIFTINLKDNNFNISTINMLCKALKNFNHDKNNPIKILISHKKDLFPIIQIIIDYLSKNKGKKSIFILSNEHINEIRGSSKFILNNKSTLLLNNNLNFTYNEDIDFLVVDDTHLLCESEYQNILSKFKYTNNSFVILLLNSSKLNNKSFINNLI